MANAAVQILQGFEDKAMPVDQAGDLMAWMGDLAGDLAGNSVENDTSLKDVSFTSTDCMVKLFWLIGPN